MTELTRSQFSNWYSYWLATGRVDNEDAGEAVSYLLAKIAGVPAPEPERRFITPQEDA